MEIMLNVSYLIKFKREKVFIEKLLLNKTNEERTR
jgi:hypothetical protein